MKKFYCTALAVIFIFFTLILLITPSSIMSKSNNIKKSDKLTTSTIDNSLSELKISEKDTNIIVSVFLNKYITGLPQPIRLSGSNVIFVNDMINLQVNLETQKSILKLPFDLHTKLRPSSKNNIIYLTVEDARLGNVPIPSSLALKFIMQNISVPSNITYQGTQLSIDLQEKYPAKLENITINNDFIILRFTLE